MQCKVFKLKKNACSNRCKLYLVILLYCFRIGRGRGVLGDGRNMFSFASKIKMLCYQIQWQSHRRKGGGGHYSANFSRNCMKVKIIGPTGGTWGRGDRPLRSATILSSPQLCAPISHPKILVLFFKLLQMLYFE